MNIRILVLGDFQGVFPARLKKKLEKEEFDLVIGVGDYGGIDDWRPWLLKMFKVSSTQGRYVSAEEYFGETRLKRLKDKDEFATKKVLQSINGLGKPVVFVFGNSDDDWYDYPFDSRMNATKRRKNFVKKLRNMKN